MMVNTFEQEPSAGVGERPSYLGSASVSQFLVHMLPSCIVSLMTLFSTVSISFLSWSLVHEAKARST